MSRTLAIIKPDAVASGHTGKIIAHLQGEGFRVLGTRMTRLSREQAGAFYAVHRERPFYGELVEFMISGAVVPLVLERDNAVAKLREVIGATDPAELATCRDGGTKQAWYDAERGLRNQIDRTYDVKMGFTLDQLQRRVPGSGVAVPPDVDLRGYLYSL